MKTGRRQKLEQEYKHLFEIYDGEETDRSYYKKGDILRGIEISDGWLDITENLLKKLDYIQKYDYYIDNPKYEPTLPLTKENSPCMPGSIHKIKIFQIKQKFGDFICYATATNDPRGIVTSLVEKAIAFAEGQATLTCERCGQVEKIERTRDCWINNICADCKRIENKN